MKLTTSLILASMMLAVPMAQAAQPAAKSKPPILTTGQMDKVHAGFITSPQPYNTQLPLYKSCYCSVPQKTPLQYYVIY
jgi:hypothetical protein